MFPFACDHLATPEEYGAKNPVHLRCRNELREETDLSRKNNINMDHYKTKGRGRQGDGIVHEEHRHSFSQVIAPSSERGANRIRALARSTQLVSRLENLRRLRRRKRVSKLRGLSARQLMERKMNTQPQTASGSGSMYGS